ncbi:hypothetical protein Tco_0685758 [Tanacetum coccineum]
MVGVGEGCGEGLGEGLGESIPSASSKIRSVRIDASEIDTTLPATLAVMFLTLLIVLDLADVQNCSTNVVETTGLTDSRAAMLLRRERSSVREIRACNEECQLERLLENKVSIRNASAPSVTLLSDSLDLLKAI